MRRRTLSFQLTIYFLFSIVAILSAVGYFYYDTGSSIVVKNASVKTDESIHKSAEYISFYTGKLKTTAGVLARNKLIRKFIDENTATGRKKANELIKTVVDTDNNLVSAVVITKDGRILSNESHLEMKTSHNMIEERWYKQAIMSKARPTLTSARKEKLSPKRENLVVSVTQEIRDDKNKNIGVVRLDIDYRAIEKYLSTLKLGKKGYAFIVDGNGNIVYHPDEGVFTSDKLKQKYMEDLHKKDGYGKDYLRYVKHEKIPDSDWKIVGVATLDELKTIKSTLLKTVLLTSIFTIIIAAFGIFFVISRWGRPIKRLQRVMNSIEGGKQEVRAEEEGSVEIRDLAVNFNRMLDKIDGLMGEIKEKEQDIREYELKALVGQINPHFLYNTLDTIIWMAEFNDGESVVETTKSLAKYFRLSLNQGNEKISLKDEIDHVRQYLFIQKKRYGEKLNYRIEELPQFGDFVLPKLVLQPIVENAIYHGIKELNRPGNIDIVVEQKEDFLTVTVRDDGKGFEQSSVKEGMLYRLGGVGVKNVDKRLKLFFGAEYRMEICSEKDKFTEVTFFFPMS